MQRPRVNEGARIPADAPPSLALGGPATRARGARWLDRVPSRWQPVLILVTLAAAAGVIRLAVYWGVPLPFCLLRTATGVPCPGCGCTRSLLAWTELDPLAALRFNPLFFLATLAVATWALGKLWRGLRAGATREPAKECELECAPGSEPFDVPGLRWRFAPLALAVLAALNWLYLCLTLPK